MNENKSGRTFFDYLHEHPYISGIFISLLVLLLSYLVFHGYNITTSGITSGRTDTLKIHDTLIVRDSPFPTLKILSTTNLGKHTVKQTKPPKAKSNSQKIENGGSGLQNNAFNYGNQAGRDINFGKMPRHPTKEDIYKFYKSVPDKNKPVSLQFFSGDQESKRFCEEFQKMLIKEGYKNISIDSYISSTTQPSELAIDTTGSTYILYVSII